MKAKQSGETETFQSAEVVFNVVNKMIEFEWEDDVDSVREALLDVLDRANSSLNMKNRDHRQAADRVRQLMERVDRPWTIKSKVVQTSHLLPSECKDLATEENVPDVHYSKWPVATVDWLCSPALFTPSLLPKMKVPDSKARGVYESPEEYLDTLQRLMVGMAFSEGHAALKPQCRVKSQETICGYTLWPVDQATGNMHCRARGCDREVVLACRNRYHNAGLCFKCAAKEEKRLLGPAGPAASTHVYDARVRRVDVTGRLYLDHLVSRRPPVHPIHWFVHTCVF